MQQKYTFLLAPVGAVGPVNACIGLAEQLRNRGHKVVFATPENWKGKLEALGFAEEVISVTTEKTLEESAAKDDGDEFAKLMAKIAGADMPSRDRVNEMMTLDAFEGMFEQIKKEDAVLKRIMERVKPDVVVADQVLHTPALMNEKTPWILSCSCNPLMFPDINLPPSDSGLSADGDRNEWKTFKERVEIVHGDFFQKFKKWLIENGGPELEVFSHPLLVKPSPWANICMFPFELDYIRLNPPKNFYRFDAFVRNTEGSFELPEKLSEGQGKLIYFSLGTIGSADIDLMKRLIKILAKSPNRFIVSKGPRGDELDLADNMWGEKNVPQTRVIPLVDLVITHGGNNTVTESFYYGKRVLVMAMLWDQLDNSTRIYETGLGLSCNPYEVTETELLSSIEKLLADNLLEKRMTSIAKRIQSTNSQSAAADLIESVAAKNKVQ